jgi:hypothetical protein
MALALACAALAGCASMHTQDVKPDAPKLPPVAVERLPHTVAVYFSAAFRSARPAHTVNFLGDSLTWRHALGDASAETFRRALAAAYTDVVELAEAPDAAAMPPGVSVVIVPQPPTVDARLDQNAVVTLYRQNVEYPVTLIESGAVTPTQTTFEGSVATGAHGVGFLSQKTLDEGMMRSASAALIVALLRRAPAGASTPSSNIEATASPAASGVGVLRLDPGVAPSDADGIRALLERPAVRTRLATLGVGTLVLFTARDVEAREKKNMYCAAGFNAGACFGFYESRTGYAVDITVWDVYRREPLTTDRIKVLHRLGAVGILLPIPFYSSNETEACAQMQQYVCRALQQ